MAKGFYGHKGKLLLGNGEQLDIKEWHVDKPPLGPKITFTSTYGPLEAVIHEATLSLLVDAI
jgi:hypothetical protein